MLARLGAPRVQRQRDPGRRSRSSARSRSTTTASSSAPASLNWDCARACSSVASATSTPATARPTRRHERVARRLRESHASASRGRGCRAFAIPSGGTCGEAFEKLVTDYRAKARAAEGTHVSRLDERVGDASPLRKLVSTAVLEGDAVARTRRRAPPTPSGELPDREHSLRDRLRRRQVRLLGRATRISRP